LFKAEHLAERGVRKLLKLSCLNKNLVLLSFDFFFKQLLHTLSSLPLPILLLLPHIFAAAMLLLLLLPFNCSYCCSCFSKKKRKKVKMERRRVNLEFEGEVSNFRYQQNPNIFSLFSFFSLVVALFCLNSCLSVYVIGERR